MRELRFHRELYREQAVETAVATYGAYASLERRDEPTHWVVRVSAASDARERRVALELANFALGKTIHERG